MTEKTPYVPVNLMQVSIDFRKHIWAVLNRYTSISVRGVFYALEAVHVLGKNKKDLDKVQHHLTDMRLRGDVPWQRISEGHRSWQRYTMWSDVREILGAVRDQYQRDYWQAQPYYVVVLIEKDALVDYIRPVCERYRIHPNTTRGNVSLNQLRKAADDMRRWRKPVVVLHLADLDGAGIDVSYALHARLTEFGVKNLEVRRLAANPCQVFGKGVPTRITDRDDSLTRLYKQVYRTDECVELDAVVAVDPELIPRLIEENVRSLIDWDLWDEERRIEEEERAWRGLYSEQDRLPVASLGAFREWLERVGHVLGEEDKRWFAERLDQVKALAESVADDAEEEDRER